MVDFTKSMEQTFEYYIVDPGTWQEIERLDNVEECTIVRDLESETLGSASLTCGSDLSDKYVRAYLVTKQNKETNRFCLGTHIYQTPSITFDGKRKTIDQDGYSPLLELKEKCPDIGFAVLSEANIIDAACKIIESRMRANFIKQEDSETLSENFVANVDDTYLSFLTDLISMANYRFDVSALGAITFAKKISTAAVQPKWTFDDGNSSILQPAIAMTRDLYGIPNVVEVVYSPSTNNIPMFARSVNKDKGSIVSTVKRGREVVYRDTSPNVAQGSNAEHLKAYADNLLKEMSALEYTISYKHGYCPVTIGDGVRLNYSRAGLNNVMAKVIRQSITCKTSCQVEETAIFTKSLWEG